MNFGKFLTGFLVLALAFLFQVWFPVGVAGGGIHGDFVLAVLVAFVFVFPFWEFLFFVVLAAFVMNWQPGLSADLLAFALVPLAAFVLHLWVRWEPWIGVAVSTVAGILILSKSGHAPLAAPPHAVRGRAP